VSSVLAVVLTLVGSAGYTAYRAYEKNREQEEAINQVARALAADKSAQSDVRGAISSVEQYYTENAYMYPMNAITGDNSGGGMPVVALGSSTQKITLSDKTQLYYVPFTAAGSYKIFYKICATNTGGTGKWYLYDASIGGGVQEVSPPANPAACA
jgi:type IV pilus assembly protein PilA